MPRPPRCRRICSAPRVDRFGPCDGAERATILLTLDEYEVIRLVDLEQQTHEQCAVQMDISRSTVQEIYENARRKLAACLVYGKPLHITGGNVRICSVPHFTSRQKGEQIMRIAVTYENGQIFQHFGHTAQFKIYDVADGQIVREVVVDTNGSGHGALAGFLMQLGVDALICGGIGGGAQMALSEVGIRLFGGVSGEADAAVAALIAGNLGYNPDVHCDHHDHEHDDGGHSCGSHGCGNHGCH